jgi:prepilin-type N-terminal cleavage/methylation domain-containing protein
MKRKGFTLVELLAVIVILGVLSTVVIPSVFKLIRDAKENSYNIMIESFEENARLYATRHRDEVEEDLDTYSYFSITLNDLKADNLLKTPVTDPRTDTMINLDKKIYIIRETDLTLDVCYEDRGCYPPIILADEITDASNIVSGTVQGLHYDASNNFYYYRGSNPSNWVEFNGSLWRIVKVNLDKSIKLIYEGERTSNGTAQDGSIANRTFDDSNTNLYSSTVSIGAALQIWYDSTITTENKNQIQSLQWCIGKIAYSSSGVTKETFLANECGTKTSSSLPIGLLYGSEYLYASLDTTCLTSYKTSSNYGYSCMNQNYLYKNYYNYWTGTPDNNTTKVWTVNSLGAIGSPVDASISANTRPVINLKNGVYADRGDGTFDSPYVIKNLVSVDKVKPVITILGESNVSIYRTDSYTDAGATATDNIDGNITSKIITTTDLNMNIPGTYKVTYTVSDISGNKTSINRIINVLDTSIVTSGLVLWLDGEDFKNSPQTTSWNDRSINNNNGVPYNFNYDTTSGSNSSGGVKFDGTDDYVNCGNNNTLNIEKGTIEAILKIASWKTNFDLIIWKNGGSWVNIDYGLLRSNTSSKLVGTISDGTTALGADGPLTPDLLLDTIYYVTFTWDGANAKMYLNGTLVDTKATTLLPKNIPANIQMSSNYKLNSDIYSIKIYNRALTDTEILNNYNVEKALKE